MKNMTPLHFRRCISVLQEPHFPTTPHSTIITRPASNNARGPGNTPSIFMAVGQRAQTHPLPLGLEKAESYKSHRVAGIIRIASQFT